MNRILIFTGFLCSLLWAGVTAITVGIPVKWCLFIDKWTLHKMSDSVFRMAYGFHYDVSNDDMPTVMFFAMFLIIFAACCFALRRIGKGPAKRYSLAIILFFSVLFRVFLLPGELIHENDIYRYLWDGKTLINHINPYKYAPSDLYVFENSIKEDFYDDALDVNVRPRPFDRTDGPRLQTLLRLRDENPVCFQRIGHPQVPTIYPPFMQMIFALSALIKQDSIILMKVIFLLFDVGVIFLVINLLKHFNKDPCLCIIYGWSPLVLKEFANSGHYDPVAIFFMLLSLFVFLKGRSSLGMSFLALATLVKFFPLVLIPVLRKYIKRRDILIFALIMGAAYLPFFIMNQTGVKGVFQGFLKFNQEWVYNGSLFAVIYIFLQKVKMSGISSLVLTKMIVGAIYILFLYLMSRQPNKEERDVIHKCFLAIAVLFIISPVANPWYFCWAIPFLCLFPYRSWLLLSGLLILSYINFRTDFAFAKQSFFYIPVLKWIIYLPFFTLLGLEQIKKKISNPINHRNIS